MRAHKTLASCSPVEGVFDRETSPEALATLAHEAAGVPADLWARALLDPARTLLSRPGKEFRARLVAAAWQIGGRKDAPPVELGAMLELIHAGSMIVDDVEDDSSERRGGPCVHVMFDVPRAINAGTWMYFLPFDLLDALALPPTRELDLRKRMTATMRDCHYGQALDLGTRIGEVPRAALPDVVATMTTLKTGRLLELAAVTGAIAAGADANTVAALGAFGRELGVGLQMLDDLGNLGGKAAPAKRLEDLRHARATWPWAWAAEQLDAAAFAHLEAMQVGLLRWPGAGDADALASALREAIGGHGRFTAHLRLDRALAALSTAGIATCGLASELARLEQSYV